MTGKTDNFGKKTDEQNIENAREEIARSTRPGNDPQVRQYASILLGKLKDSEGVEPLIMALRDPDKKVRDQAAKSLGEIGEPSVDSLVLLLDDPDWKVRYRATEALGITGSKKAVPFLIVSLDDPKDHVRYMAAKSLGETGDGSCEKALIARLGDENEFVRRSAALTLGKTGGTAAKGALEHSLTRETSENTRVAIENALKALEKKV
ncbi:MAG: HEAT repeat domain-containing protein [Methanoregulaceae archaeon]|nr:HEAT repeat domain-containing protein [Methanoregulaceae archaeon]